MKNKTLFKNALLNTIKQFCNIAFPLITFPYVSRVLQVENYGKYTFSNSIVNYFCMLAALGITNYAIREGSIFREDEKNLSKFSNEVFTINILTMCLSLLLLLCLILLFPKLKDYRVLLLIQSSMIFFNTIGVEWLFSIFEDFKYITIRSVFIQIISLVLLFVFVKDSDDYVIYALITTFSSGSASIISFFYSKKHLKLNIVKKINFKKHIKPMLVLFFNTLAITIYVNSDITILGVLKDNHVVGLYNVSARVYTIIKQLLNAIVIVVLPRISLYLSQSKDQEFKEIVTSVFHYLIILILPTITGLFLMSKNIIYLVAGESYVDASYSLQILSVSIFFSLLASFITTGILLPKKKENKILNSTIIGALVNVVLNLLIIPFFSLNGAAFTTLIAEMVVFWVSLNYSKEYYDFRCLMKNKLPSILGCILIAIICIINKLIIQNVYLCLFVSMISSLIIYVFIIVGLSKNNFKTILSKIFH